MNTTATRITLALICGLAWASTAMSANEMRFSDLEARIAAVEQKTSAIPGLKPAAFLSDGDPIDAIAPNDAVGSRVDEELSSPVTSHHSATGGSSSCCGRAGGCGQTCCADACGGDCPDCCGQSNGGTYYAEVQNMFLRAHMMEDAAGKLSETYEYSPRFILGYEAEGGMGARVRYWTYSRTTDVLNDPRNIHFEFDVFDAEATARFKSCRSELVVAGGFRFANLRNEWDDESVSADLPGITVAADFRGLICGGCGQEWAAVCGARWSVLGGDWEGDDSGFVEPLRDDNLVVQELYAGAEYSVHTRSCVVWARLAFEMQNWHSDVMSQTSGVDSISILGPGIHAGCAF